MQRRSTVCITPSVRAPSASSSFLTPHYLKLLFNSRSACSHETETSGVASNKWHKERSLPRSHWGQDFGIKGIPLCHIPCDTSNVTSSWGHECVIRRCEYHSTASDLHTQAQSKRGKIVLLLHCAPPPGQTSQQVDRILLRDDGQPVPFKQPVPCYCM